MLLPPPETKKATRAYKPIKPSNHPGGLSEKFSYNGQALLASEPQPVLVASASPVREEREERRLGFDGHPGRDGPAYPSGFEEADSHFMQREMDPAANPFEEAHEAYSAQKQQQTEAGHFASAHAEHQRREPKEAEEPEERQREKKERKEKKEKKEKKDKKEKKEKKRKSEHRQADRSSAEASPEKKEKKDRRDRTEDQDSDTHNLSINKTLDLRDKQRPPLALNPLRPEEPEDLPLAHSHASRTEPPEELADDHLAKSNLESSAEKKAQIRVVRRPKKKPEQEKGPAGPSSQFPDAQTQDYHVRMRDRQAKLQEFLERKAQNHRAKLEQTKKRAEDRHQKLAGKPLWAAADKMHLDGNSRAVRPEHTLSLMFEGKSYEQYYRDKYFEEVLGMHCPEEFRAEKQVPTVVRPAHAFKSPVGSRFRPLSLAQQAAGNGPEYLGPALTIQEPLIIKYHTRPPQNSQDWGNETMDRYRYFNQDRKDVKFIRSSRKQTIQDALLLGATAPQPSPGFRESHSLKLPTLSKQKLNLATSRKQLIF